MKTFGHKCLVMVSSALLGLVTALPARAQLGNPGSISLNSSNAITADATNSYTDKIISTEKAKDLAIQIRFKLISGAETGTVLFKFSKSISGTTSTNIVEDTPFFTWSIPANGSSFVTQVTNLTVNAVPKVFLTQVATTNDVAMTNISITYFAK